MKRNRIHFSWSQYSTWLSSKREFWKRYNQGVPAVSNRYFDKGKELANLLDGKEIAPSIDPLIDEIRSQIPVLDIPEQDLTYFVEGYEVLCYLDSVNFGYTFFNEYKTGKIPWTQEKTNNHDQLLFYALGIYKEKGFVPGCNLVWVETMENEETKGLVYTGKVELFDRTFTVEEVIAFEQKILNTIKEIEEYEYTEHELDDEKVKQYVDIQEQIKALELQLSSIKMEIEDEMTELDVNYGKSKYGNFSFSQRKSWKYSEIVGELKKDIAKQQAAEQKNGDAKFTVNKFITFKASK